jgi:hypothetical protein
MRNKVITLLAVGTAVLVWIGVSAQQQEMLPRPGPGSGVIDVRGTVSVAGVSEVRFSDVPDVNIANVPSVLVGALPPVPFIQRGTRYVVTWASGEQEEVTVTNTTQGGWVQVGTARWINLDSARAVEAAR